MHLFEALGCRVEIPDKPLCCGRPLYDYGMLDLARRQLEEILDVLSPRLAGDVPIVVLEPSCLAVFIDELPHLLSHDERARRLADRAMSLEQFLARLPDRIQIPSLARRALVHPHCHHRALLGVDDIERSAARLGLDAEITDAGCCGMAGGFGFEHDHYEVSVAVGERRLLPAVRAANPETLLIADGFSCREQIEQLAGRRAYHFAEIACGSFKQR